MHSTTPVDLRARQLEDPDLSIVIRWKDDVRERPAWESISAESNAVKTYWAQWDRLALREVVLYRRWESEACEGIRWQLLVSRCMRQDLLSQLHDEKTAGHLGVNKTVGRVKEKLYWPNCSRDVKDWCRKCGLCA